MYFKCVVTVALSFIFAIINNNYCYSTVAVQSSSVNSIPNEIQKVLLKNVGTIVPISVVWQQQRSASMNIDNFCKRIGGGPGLYNFFEPEDNVFMWQDEQSFLFSHKKEVQIRIGLIQVDDKGKVAGTVSRNEVDFVDSYRECAQDTQKYYRGKKVGNDQAPKELSVWSLEKTLTKDADYPVFDQTYMTNIGFKFPVYGREIKMQPKSFILFLLESGGKLLSLNEDVLEGDKSLKVTISSDHSTIYLPNQSHIYTFWILPKLSYAVKQIEVTTIDNQIEYLVVNDDFMLLPGKTVYFPRKTHVKYYVCNNTWSGRLSEPLYQEDYVLVDVSTKKINKDQFNLSKSYTQSGVMVTDRTLRGLNDTDNGLTFIVPANPADLDRVIEATLNGTDFVPTPLPSTTAIVIKWLLCIAGIAMILYAGYEKFIKKKKKQ
jgi:hypothetical protein